jgi:hypothetical protein
VAEKAFTVDEANQALSKVRILVGQVIELYSLVPELQDAARIAEYRRSRPDATESDQERWEEATSGAQSAELELIKAVRGLEAMGVVIKDPREGLIDFPAYREGELVELCWKLGEERVAYWHRIGEGFAGRKKL